MRTRPICAVSTSSVASQSGSNSHLYSVPNGLGLLFMSSVIVKFGYFDSASFVLEEFEVYVCIGLLHFENFDRT
jgi:hypothetical protein